jgi:hypothetical protein
VVALSGEDLSQVLGGSLFGHVERWRLLSRLKAELQRGGIVWLEAGFCAQHHLFEGD